MTIWRSELSALHTEHVVPRGSTGPDLIDEAFLFLEGIPLDDIHLHISYQQYEGIKSTQLDFTRKYLL